MRPASAPSGSLTRLLRVSGAQPRSAEHSEAAREQLERVATAGGEEEIVSTRWSWGFSFLRSAERAEFGALEQGLRERRPRRAVRIDAGGRARFRRVGRERRLVLRAAVSRASPVDPRSGSRQPSLPFSASFSNSAGSRARCSSPIRSGSRPSARSKANAMRRRRCLLRDRILSANASAIVLSRRVVHQEQACVATFVFLAIAR
jgi:hypothetical protein